LQNLDVIKLVNKHAGAFFTNMLYNNIDLPSTRNLNTLNGGQHVGNEYSKTNTYQPLETLTAEAFFDNSKAFKKKNLKNYVVVVVIVVLLIIIFCSF
jgi:hypothetical protein